MIVLRVCWILCRLELCNDDGDQFVRIVFSGQLGGRSAVVDIFDAVNHHWKVGKMPPLLWPLPDAMKLEVGADLVCFCVWSAADELDRGALESRCGVRG